MMISQNKKTVHSLQLILRITKKILIVLGSIMFVFILLSFTKYPYMAYRNLGENKSTLTNAPEAIVVYSAAGMPDPHTLMRIYTTSIFANKYPKASVYIAYPVKTAYDSLSLSMLTRELYLKGIDSLRLHFEPEGTNTYTQTLNICKQFKAQNIKKVQVISSPEHLYRAIACFKKQGFNNIGSAAALEQVISPEALKSKDRSHRVEQSLMFRYNMWSYMKYEITVCREYLAIAYYKLKGWI